MAIKHPAGWGSPGLAAKVHHFAEDEVVSTCGKWLFAGDIEPVTAWQSKYLCKACEKKLRGKK